MDILLTYDPNWKFTPKDQTPFWPSLDTVNFVKKMLTETGNNIITLKTNQKFKTKLREFHQKNHDVLVFWLNEFLPPYFKEKFVVEILEHEGMYHTGPKSKALSTGLDKEASKKIFRELNLLTPASYTVSSDYSVIKENRQAGFVIIKPLLQGNSRGMDETSVVDGNDFEAIEGKVKQIQEQYNEAVLVEEYISGENVREFSIPLLISHTGKIAKLPIVEIDFEKIPKRQFKFLDHSIKDEIYYLIIPANIEDDLVKELYSDAERISAEIGCRDMTRLDLRANEEGNYWIEINVNCGKNRFSYLSEAFYTLGFNYKQLIGLIPYQGMLTYGLEPPKQLEELITPVMQLF